MKHAGGAMSLQEARKTLEVAALATPTEVRRAFRDAAKRAHPDRPGGAPDAFRKVVEAYQRLNGHGLTPLPPPKRARPAADPVVLTISPQVALVGGVVEHRLGDGRMLRITLPPGLRAGDTVAAGERRLTVAVRAALDICVRGDDVWITVHVPVRTLADGGRIAVETPLGRRIVWLTRKDRERGLLRLTNQGLPARGRHGRGHLFLRLAPQAGAAQSSARTLLDRFAAAWAA
jgi:curved DNA-binding protein